MSLIQVHAKINLSVNRLCGSLADFLILFIFSPFVYTGTLLHREGMHGLAGISVAFVVVTYSV